MSFALKKQIKKELLLSDWAGKVDEAAVAALATIIEEQHGGQLHGLHDILRACTAELSADGKITAASVHAAAAPNGGAQQVELIEITDAFSIPPLAFDPVQRKLFLNNKPRHIHASAEAKNQLYMQRLLLIQQRLQRSKMFQQSNLLLPNSSSRCVSIQLTDLQSLKGVFGVTRYVMGCISRSEDGRYMLEDSTGSAPLDLATAETAAGFYTENCVVIAEGALGHDGAFHVRALGLPPVEPRSDLPLAAKRLNLWGGAGGGLGPDTEAGGLLALEEVQRGAADRVVVLANVWLDRPEVLDSLHMLLSGFSGVVTVPTVFVLMGNFHSRAGAGGGAAAHGGRAGGGDAMLSGGDVDYGVMRELFGQLAGVIDQYPRLKAESRFVFVPGPDDPGPGAILPQPPLPRTLTSELRRVLPGALFTSNPCRLRYGTQRIVLFRHDLQRRLRRRSLLALSGSPDGAAPDPTQPAASAGGTPSGPSSSALWGHLALTLLQQGHLAPLPLLAQPVYWQYDSALSLYPLPDAVILADATAGQEEFVHEGCRVLNPGVFPGGFFSAYLPCVQQAEMSELPRPGQEVDEGADEEEEGAQATDATGADDVADAMHIDPRGGGGAEGARPPVRPALQQRQTVAGPHARAGQKPPAAGAAAGRAQKPRQARAQRQGQGGRGRQAQLQTKPRAAALGGEAAGGSGVAEGAGAEGDAEGQDVEMADQEGGQKVGELGGGAGGAKGPRGGGADAAKGAGRQGTLAQAWAKQPARVTDVVVLEDEEGEEGAAGEDGEDDDTLGTAAAEVVAARRRQQQAARKRRAVVVEDEEEGEEEGDGGLEVGRVGGGARTWLDDDEEDWQEDE